MSLLFLTVIGLICASICQTALPPRDVYSGKIVNESGKQVTCSISWSKIENQPLRNQKFDLGHTQWFSAREQVFSMGTWEARAAIEEIRCGTMFLRAPFDKVHGPTENWKFVITANGIESVGSA